MAFEMSCRKRSGLAIAVTFKLQLPGVAAAAALSPRSTLTSRKRPRLAGNCKRGAASRRVSLPSYGRQFFLNIDNLTVNRRISNNQLIMNCKWGRDIDPALAFGMCGQSRGGGLRLPMSMIHQAALFCAWWPLTVSLSLALVICCCSAA